MVLQGFARTSVLCLVSVAGCSLHEIGSGRLDDNCLLVVADYVKSSRGWGGDVYDIAPEGTVVGLRGYAVMHRSDGGKLTSGELKSFHVDLDSECKAIVDELGYQ